MDWVKLTTGYFRDLAIVSGDDAMEVMFTRGLAYCGEAETGGFIPNAMIAALTRRPRGAERIAKQLVHVGLWDAVSRGKVRGYEVRNWHEHQAELERLVERKARDARRKRAARAAERAGQSDAASADASTDSPTSSLPGEIEVEVDAAAAARGGSRSTVDDLPAQLVVLRSKFREWTALEKVSFANLKPEQANEIAALINKHGDQRLIDVAKSTHRGAAFVQAYLDTWRDLAGPRLVTDDSPRCDVCSRTRTACERAATTVDPEDRHEFRSAS